MLARGHNHPLRKKVGIVALQSIKSAANPVTIHDEQKITQSYESAFIARAEARCALHMFIESHDIIRPCNHDRVELSKLLWDAAKTSVRVKELHLDRLRMLHAPELQKLEDEIDPALIEILANAHHDLSQARLDEAMAKTYFFSQKVEVARESLASVNPPIPEGDPQQHLAYMSNRAVYLMAMSQHMAAYRDESAMRCADAREIVRGFQAQGDTSGDLFAQAQQYQKDAEEALEDAKMAYDNVLASVRYPRTQKS